MSEMRWKGVKVAAEAQGAKRRENAPPSENLIQAGRLYWRAGRRNGLSYHSSAVNVAVGCVSGVLTAGLYAS
jgi:hypothetical protein